MKKHCYVNLFLYYKDPLNTSPIEDQVEEYPVIPISGSTLVDTNGAGDAFVGGFLAHFVQDQDFTLCMDQGLSAAHMILQVQGCRLPGQEK